MGKKTKDTVARANIEGLINHYLKDKLGVDSVIEVMNTGDNYEILTIEIQQAIKKYNQYKIQGDSNLYINSNHLKSIFEKDLPEYREILNQLEVDKALSEKVFTELRDSDYFHDVYKISDSFYLLVNLLILIYRTSVLFLYPDLRKHQAQISSVIEEMIVSMEKVSGQKTKTYAAIVHWIRDYENEGFSEGLSLLVD